MSLRIRAEALIKVIHSVGDGHWLTEPCEHIELPAESERPLGPLDIVHPSPVQLISKTEFRFLETQSDELLSSNLRYIFSQGARLLVFCDGLSPSRSIVQIIADCGLRAIAATGAAEAVNQQLSEPLTRFVKHGVFVSIYGVGVLIQGESGVGKSELALDLISRGHQLICDDAPIFTRVQTDWISGSSPENIRDFMEIRGIGLINIADLFGKQAVQIRKRLQLIIKLEAYDTRTIDRLGTLRDVIDVLGVGIPAVTIPVSPGRNLGVLVETVVREHLLRQDAGSGLDQLIRRQQEYS